MELVTLNMIFSVGPSYPIFLRVDNNRIRKLFNVYIRESTVNLKISTEHE
jgi:hypothetical protein